MSEQRFLSDAECAELLRIARDAITAFVRDGKTIALDDYAMTPPLRTMSGAFVTLRRGEELRGCIGYTKGVESLAETVRDCAISAAVRDPRFDPVATEEIGELRIEVSALVVPNGANSPFIPVADIAEISIGRDGLYLDCAGGHGGGFLLPQVATDRGWGVDQFLDAICDKAGVARGAWRDEDATLYRFSAQVIEEV